MNQLLSRKENWKMAMTMYKRYEKIEKPLIELAKQIKKSKAKDDNIKKGIQLILGEEANAVASYLEDVLGFDSEYALPAMHVDKRNLGHKPEPDMQEVENRISDMDECTDLINMITSFLPPGALIVASQAEHYSIMGEILEAYRAKNFMAVKELICANWKTATPPENPETPTPTTPVASEETAEEEEMEDDAGYDITDFTEETRELDISKFTKLAGKRDKDAIEDGWCYTAAGVFTGVLRPDMTIEEIEELKENRNTAIEAVKAYLNCMDFAGFSELMFKSEFDKNIRRVEYLAKERNRNKAIAELKEYWRNHTEESDLHGSPNNTTILNHIFDNIIILPKTVSVEKEDFDSLVDMTMSILNEVGITGIDAKIIDEVLTARINPEGDING